MLSSVNAPGPGSAVTHRRGRPSKKTCSGSWQLGFEHSPPCCSGGTLACERHSPASADQSAKTSEPRISAPSPSSVSGLLIVTVSR